MHKEKINLKSTCYQPYIGYVILLSALLMAVSCAHRDYAFVAAGKVHERNGNALPDVKVTLKLKKPVFDVVTPVKEESVVTDKDGKFNFWFITDQRLQKYTLHFSKEGYNSFDVKSSEINIDNYFVEMEKINKIK